MIAEGCTFARTVICGNSGCASEAIVRLAPTRAGVPALHGLRFVFFLVNRFQGAFQNVECLVHLRVCNDERH